MSPVVPSHDNTKIIGDSITENQIHEKELIKEESIKPSSFIICNGSTIIIALLVCPAIWIPINFYLFLTYDSDKLFDDEGIQQIPTISLSGSYQPMSVFFTYGLHVEALLLAFACIALYLFIDDQLLLAAAASSNQSLPGMTTAHPLSLNNPDSCPTSPISPYSCPISPTSPTPFIHHHHPSTTTSSERNSDATTETDIEAYDSSERRVKTEAADRSPASSSSSSSWAQRILSFLELFVCGCFCKVCGLCRSNNNNNSIPIASIRRWNYFCLWIGFLVALSMSGVGSVTMMYQQEIHTLLAIMMFITGITHMVAFYFFILPHFPLCFTTCQRSQILIALLISIPINLFVVAFPRVRSYINCGSYDCLATAVEFDTLPEFTTIVALLIYIQAFQSNLKNIVFLQMVKTR